MNKIDFYIFRHGQTDWNKRLMLQGRSDIPINDTGKAQAWALIPMLEDKSLDLIISSSLQRAAQTATIVSKVLNIPVETDSRLVEINFGKSEGMTFADYTKENGESFCDRIFSSVADADMDIPDDTTGAESKRQAQTRAMDALTDIAQHSSANTIGIACHGFIMSLVAAFTSKGKFIQFNNGDLLHIAYENDEWHYIDVVRNTPKA